MKALQSLTKRFNTIRSNTKSSLRTKKKELMKLQHDLKKKICFVLRIQNARNFNTKVH